MKRYTTWIIIAAIMFVAAWFLPVIDKDNGWVAFRAALAPIWPYEGLESTGALAFASGLTNFVFVVAAPLLWRWPARTARIAMWILIASALLNAHWFVLSSDRGELRAGYHLWLAAFLVLALSAYLGRSQASADKHLAAGA